MTGAAPKRGRPLPPWALLAALLLCVGHSVAHAHLHLDEHEEEVCTICGISEPGQIQEIGWVDAQPCEWHPLSSLPVVSTTLLPQPYEFGRPRAPPFTVS